MNRQWKQRKRDQKNRRSFLLLGLLLYTSFLLLDWGITDELLGWNPYDPGQILLSCGLKYLSVLLCFFWGLGEKNPCLERAQLLVLGADLLLLSGTYLELGILFFIGVQAYYGLYLHGSRNKGEFLLQGIALALGAGLLGCGFYLLASGFPGNTSLLLERGFSDMILCGVGAAYGAALVSNLWQAWKGENYFFAGGLFLLLLCDSQVLFYNLPLHTAMALGRNGYLWQELAGRLIWLFYLPSQVMIALEALGLRREALGLGREALSPSRPLSPVTTSQALARQWSLQRKSPLSACKIPPYSPKSPSDSGD